MTHLTDTDFDTTIADSKVPVLVDFYMDFCQPCRTMSPTIEKLATEYTGKVTIVKVKGDDAFETCKKLNISAVPTLILYKDGVVFNKTTGLKTEEQLRTLLESSLI